MLKARWLTGALFVLAGLNHFWHPAPYRAIVPPWLPRPDLLVAWSGYAEIVLGGLLVGGRGRRLVGAGLIALLIAIFPANLYMALHPARFPQLPPWLLWARLPFQPLLILWVYWLTREPR